MTQRRLQLLAVLVSLSMLSSACSSARPPAPQEQQAGPKIVTGKVTYTNLFFTEGVAEPEVILEDEGGFVTRDRKFVIPIQSQVIGEITSDFYTSPFSYSLSLPAEPNGTLHDVNHDGKTDKGVMVFAVAYWTNTWGDPYLEVRDQGGGGWSSAYASTRVSSDRASYLEVYGGTYLVYAPDDKQQFPSGFGADKKLFTDDDPIMNLPAGWSVIDMDKNPFTIDQSANPAIDLYEPADAALDDFSKLSYTAAFDKMAEKFKKEYAFTDLKKIDWDAKVKEFRPRFEQAEQSHDVHAYELALRDFLWSIPDTHVGFASSVLSDDFSKETAGGLGFAMRQTADGKIIANFITDGGPAQQAGMQWGAEIISLDDKPVNDVVDAVVPWSSPFSNATSKHLQQLRYATRFPLDKGQVVVKFTNPSGAPQTATIPVAQERASFAAASFNAGQSATELPVTFDVLPSGVGYIKINSFLDNDVLSIQVWERAIKYFKDNQVSSVILDMRHNGGGSGWLADQMAAYFFDKQIVVGNTARYNQGSGEFYMDPGDEERMIPPPSSLQFSGPVVVMVGPACYSACEFFSYAMTVNKRATVVGEYPTEGAGGSVERFKMPENIQVQMTIGRAVDTQGQIRLEGKGVVPDLKVPVTYDTLKREANGEDVVLQAAVDFLTKPQNAGVTPSGPPTIASKDDARTALSGSTPYLEGLATEKYDASVFAKPGDITYTVQLKSSDSTIWGYGWCAKDVATVAQNFQNIKLKFTLDGQDVPLDSFNTQNSQPQGMACRLVYTSLSNWPAGEHHVTTATTFTAKINDGTADYAAGDYVLDYTVYASQ